MSFSEDDIRDELDDHAKAVKVFKEEYVAQLQDQPAFDASAVESHAVAINEEKEKLEEAYRKRQGQLELDLQVVRRPINKVKLPSGHIDNKKLLEYVETIKQATFDHALLIVIAEEKSIDRIRNISEDYREALGIIEASNVRRMQEQLTQMQTKLADVELERDKLIETQKRRDKEHVETLMAKHETDDELCKCREHLLKVEVKGKQLQADLGKLRDVEKRLQDAQKEHTKQKASLDEQLQDAKQTLEDTKSQLTSCQQRAGELRDARNHLEWKYNTSKAKLERKSKQNKRTNRQLDATRHNWLVVEGELGDTKQREQDLKKRLADTEDRERQRSAKADLDMNIAYAEQESLEQRIKDLTDTLSMERDQEQQRLVARDRNMKRLGDTEKDLLAAQDTCQQREQQLLVTRARLEAATSQKNQAEWTAIEAEKRARETELGVARFLADQSDRRGPSTNAWLPFASAVSRDDRHSGPPVNNNGGQIYWTVPQSWPRSADQLHDSHSAGLVHTAGRLYGRALGGECNNETLHVISLLMQHLVNDETIHVPPVLAALKKYTEVYVAEHHTDAPASLLYFSLWQAGRSR